MLHELASSKIFLAHLHNIFGMHVKSHTHIKSLFIIENSEIDWNGGSLKCKKQNFFFFSLHLVSRQKKIFSSTPGNHACILSA